MMGASGGGGREPEEPDPRPATGGPVGQTAPDASTEVRASVKRSATRDAGQQQPPPPPPPPPVALWVRRAGFALLAVAWIVPLPTSEVLGGRGAYLLPGLTYFIGAAVLAWGSFVEATGWRDLVAAAGFTSGVLANFCILARFSGRTSWMAAATPWLVLATAVSRSEDAVAIGGFQSDPRFLCWAVGITLVHAAVYFEPQRR